MRIHDFKLGAGVWDYHRLADQGRNVNVAERFGVWDFKHAGNERELYHLLTAAEQSAMRTVAEQALPGTAVIYSSAVVSDGGGGGTTTYTAAGTVACRIAPIRGDEREMGERISPDADSIVTLPQSASITEANRLVIAGGTFNVAAIRDRSYEITQRVEVVKQT